MPLQFAYKAGQPGDQEQNQKKDLQLVVVLMNTAEHLNVHCVSTYQTVYACIFAAKKNLTYYVI